MLLICCLPSCIIVQPDPDDLYALESARYAPFPPLTRIFLRTREPGFAGLLHMRCSGVTRFWLSITIRTGWRDFVAGRAPEFVHPVQTNALLGWIIRQHRGAAG